MKRIVCFHCGEHYAARRPVCPHCGADRDMTHSEAPPELQARGWGEMDDEAYADFLKNEGLAPAGPPSRLPGKALGWLVLMILLASGLLLLLL